MESVVSYRFFSFLELFSKEEIAKRCSTVYVELKERLKDNGNVRLGAGHTRIVFSYGTEHVIKIPMAYDPDNVRRTVQANLIEYLISKRVKTHFVPCEMYFYKGLPVLISEKILPVYGPMDAPKQSEIPEILRDLWDGWQIGLDKNENVVCYDCGCEEEFLDKFPKSMRDFTEEEYRNLMSFSPSLEIG